MFEHIFEDAAIKAINLKLKARFFAVKVKSKIRVRLVKFLGVDLIISDLELQRKILRDMTEVSAQIGVRGDCKIILTGQFKNKDYVKIFDLGSSDFEHLSKHLTNLAEHHKLNRVAAPMGMANAFESSLRHRGVKRARY